jgi:4-diphosphocytidyl-2-C-methyl-D-erythritol kinase
VTFTARAFAKINLDLRIDAVLPDGYHELRTTFQSIALHDVLTFRRTRGPFTIRCDDPRCPLDDGNIVRRAADHLWRAVGRAGGATGVSVSIDKRIPMEAGLGGGSADAAAALRALPLLWRVRPSAADIHSVAASLGADVPFFLRGGTAVGVGRGDCVTSIRDGARRWVVLVIPPFGVSTKDAYGWFDQSVASGAAPPAPTRRGRSNDLQGPVVSRHPEIGELVQALRRCGASGAAMSGSGSAVFGMFHRLPGAEAAAVALAGAGRRVLVTRTLAAAAYRRRSRPVLARK